MTEYNGINLSRDKRTDKNTTTHKFKMDLIDTFKTDRWYECSVLEVSCYKGFTTSILSRLFTKVYAVDQNRNYLNDAKTYNRNRFNIEFIKRDVYGEKKWDELPIVDVVFIDCNHDYGSVTSDLHESIKHLNDGGFIVMDDYGLYSAVRKAVKDFMEEMDGKININKFIGEPKGSTARKGKIMDDFEGIILEYK